jgi:hypothetical protein
MPPKISIFTAGFCLAVCLALPTFAEQQRMEEVTTDRVDFTAGGVIHVENSFGELNIAAWDEPSVQITATRYTYRQDTPREKERTGEKLKRIQVT